MAKKNHNEKFFYSKSNLIPAFGSMHPDFRGGGHEDREAVWRGTCEWNLRRRRHHQRGLLIIDIRVGLGIDRRCQREHQNPLHRTVLNSKISSQVWFNKKRKFKVILVSIIWLRYL